MSIHSLVGTVGSHTTSRSRRAISVGEATSAVALAFDALLIIAISVASGIVFHRITYGIEGDIESFVATGIITAVIFCSALRILGTRRAEHTSSAFGRIRDGLVVWCITFLFLLIIAFSLKISAAFSRGTIFSFYGSGLVAISLSRFWVPRALAGFSYFSAYRGQEPIIIAPSAAAARWVHEHLARQGCAQVRLVEFDDTVDVVTWPQHIKHLTQRIFDEARAAAPGEIYFIPGKLRREASDTLLQRLHLLPRAVYLAPNPDVAALLRYEVRPLGTELVLEMQKAPLSTSERLAKRFFDLSIAGAALVLLAPVLAAIAVAIKMDSPGPALFKQTRNGYRGRPFRILKFRTMRVMEDGDVVTQATRADSRVTRLGTFLRKSSLDELPQLINVFLGDMSIVGPRPHADAHDKLYSALIDDYEVRQHVKPGITGWAQVHGFRGATPHVDLMYRRIELDIWYSTHCTFALDIQIVWRTFFEVFRQTNAY